MRIVENAEALDGLGEGWIAQPLVEGMSASVGYIVAATDIISLPPAFQSISVDGRFRYGGGGVPIRKNLEQRAERLGRRALRGIPGLLGYVGVDMMLDEDSDRARDIAIEINPRLTTSYVGLRAHLNGNLAQLMLELAEGTPGIVGLKPKGRVAFTSAGRWSLDPARHHWNLPCEIPTDPTFIS